MAAADAVLLREADAVPDALAPVESVAVDDTVPAGVLDDDRLLVPAPDGDWDAPVENDAVRDKRVPDAVGESLRVAGDAVTEKEKAPTSGAGSPHCSTASTSTRTEGAMGRGRAKGARGRGRGACASGDDCRSLSLFQAGRWPAKNKRQQQLCARGRQLEGRYNAALPRALPRRWAGGVWRGVNEVR